MGGGGTPVEARGQFDPALGIKVDQEPTFSIGEKKRFIRRLDEAADRLPPVEGISSQRDLDNWAREIRPYFAYEGIVGSTIAPKDIEYIDYPDARRNFHVLGQAACSEQGQSGIIKMNGRGNNPESSWYAREDSIWTLTHELAHMQGGPLCEPFNPKTESNTQIVTAEILAAMSNHGNQDALRVLLIGLRDMGMSSLQYEMRDRPDDYEDFRDEIYGGDPIREARYEKSKRHWEKDPFTLNDILLKYSKVPFEAIMDGIQDQTVESVVFEKTYGYAPPTKVEEPLRMDDLHYVMTNLEELTNGER